MKDTLKWDKRYLGIAREVATWSKDPGTKVGSVAVGKKGQLLSQGYNGLPRGVFDDENKLLDRDWKLKRTIHAEMNCVYNAALNGVSLEGSDVYVFGLPVCLDCAKGLIQVGVKRLVASYPLPVRDEWKLSGEISTELFKEAGVISEYVDYWS